MKKNQFYRLCLKSGSFAESPTFKIKVGKFQKTVNTYFIPSDKQRYNYDLIIERSKQPEVIIEVYINEKMIGQAVLKFDTTKPDMPNETVDVMDNKNKVGAIDCSLKKIEKKTKKPAMKIRVIQASYDEDLDRGKEGKMDPFIVIKYADNNYKTKVAENQGKTPIWKQEFNIGTSDNDRIFLESWEQDANGSEFIGVTTVDIGTKLGAGEIELQVTRDKKKKGTVKVELTEHTSKKPDPSDKQINDKNFTKKRNLKTYAVEAVLKQQIKKGGFIKIQSGEQDYETTPIYTSLQQLKWNQSFQIKCTPGDELIAKLCIKDQIEEELGRCSIKVNQITNKKYELSLLSPAEKQMGKLYLQFYDEQLDIGEDISANQSAANLPPQAPQSPETKTVTADTAARINHKHQQIKQRYANRQSIHDYMSEVNAVIQEGVLMLAKQRPEDPIRQLGLFLINYKK